jgi:hypothetical protein
MVLASKVRVEISVRNAPLISFAPAWFRAACLAFRPRLILPAAVDLATWLLVRSRLLLLLLPALLLFVFLLPLLLPVLHLAIILPALRMTIAALRLLILASLALRGRILAIPTLRFLLLPFFRPRLILLIVLIVAVLVLALSYRCHSHTQYERGANPAYHRKSFHGSASSQCLTSKFRPRVHTNARSLNQMRCQR